MHQNQIVTLSYIPGDTSDAPKRTRGTLLELLRQLTTPAQKHQECALGSKPRKTAMRLKPLFCLTLALETWRN